MKTTTTIEEIIRNQAKHDEGWDDIFNHETNLFIRQGGMDALTYQIAMWTPLVQKLCDKQFFGMYKMADADTDLWFKRVFISHFINRQIAMQTIDMFRPNCVSLIMMNEPWLINSYKHFNDLFSNKSDSKTHDETTADDTNKQEGKVRTANRSLPQDTPTIDLNNDIVRYADENDFNNHSDTTTDHKTTTDDHTMESHVYNAAVVKTLDNIFKDKLNDFDRELFLQIG